MFRRIAAACALAIAIAPPLNASQDNLYSPTTGTVSGLTLTSNYNNAMKALASCNSGTAAPVNVQGGAVAGQCWLDTSTTPYAIKNYDGATTWVITGYLDATNHIYIPALGGGTATLASAGTTVLSSAPQTVIDISGTTTITSFGGGTAVPPGTIKIVRFLGALTLTHNATTLILPSAQSITTAANDVAIAVRLSGSNWQVVSYSRASGEAIKNPAVDVGTVVFSDRADTPAKWVQGYGQALSRATYPEYLAAVSRAQTGTRTSGSAVIADLADTSKFTAGQAVEGTGIPTGATVLSASGTSLTMSANATTSGSSTVTVILTGYGTGGNSTTVGVKDCRGRTLAGRDNMGGTAANRLTDWYGVSLFGTGAGAGAQNQTLTNTQLPVTTLTFTGTPGTTSSDGAHTHTVSKNDLGGTGVLLSNSPGVFSAGPNSITTSSSGAHTHSFTPAGTISSFGGGGTVPTVQPTSISDCIVRVLP